MGDPRAIGSGISEHTVYSASAVYLNVSDKGTYAISNVSDKGIYAILGEKIRLTIASITTDPVMFLN